ncbi:hypothetical protein IDH14_03640 [Pelagibacterales bacterium SAG-MED33]|nr:hypothetical protein [Pelagibacterales bacterium SAG-MED33]
MIKNQNTNQLKYLILISFLIHLISINFFPTNFEGGYGHYSNLFSSSNKLLYIKTYYSAQFNTYIFSALGSVLNFLIPSINGFQAIKIISAFSYFFLGFGLLNILKFYKFKENLILFILIIFLNSIIFSYGFRAFNDLFAFSLSIFALSRILNNYNNKLIFFDALLLGFAIVIKSYNLIMIIPIIILFYNQYRKTIELKKIIFTLKLIFIPVILWNTFTYNFLGFVLAPTNEDLEIAIIGSDKGRNYFWVLNNFIFYLGYLALISTPFIFVSFFSIIKKNDNKKILIILLLSLISSFYLQKFFFISSELDLGPLQSLLPEEIYKSIIIFLFIFFSLFVYLFLTSKELSKKKLDYCKIILISILMYLFALSFIKAAQRYLILPIPFIYLIIFNYYQPKLLIYITMSFYIIINLILLANYYIVGESSKKILNFLESNQILENTAPNVIVPHVYHLYFDPLILNKKKIIVKTSDYKITHYDKNSIFSSKINFFGYEFKKFSVIKLKK